MVDQGMLINDGCDGYGLWFDDEQSRNQQQLLPRILTAPGKNVNTF